MTTMPSTPARLPLAELVRAANLPSPAKRRAIRERVGLSRRAVAEELGVSGATVAWWESENGFDPRPARAVAYRKLLDQLEAVAVELGLT